MKSALNLPSIRIFFVAIAFTLAGCGGGGGGGGGGGANSGTSNLTTTTVTPFKGKFINGTVSLADANGSAVPLANNTGAINTSGVASITYGANVLYPLTVSVNGTYLNEITGAQSTTTVPLMGLIPDAPTAASGVPVTAITDIAVSQLLQQASGVALTSPFAVAAIAGAANSVLGQTYAQAMTPPVFDSQGKSADPATLQLAALSVVADTRGTGTELTAKLSSLAQSLV